MGHEAYLKMAIEEAAGGMRIGDGGPFGAVVVKDDEVIGKGHNKVVATHDPTAHAEIMAIRDACNRVKSHHLTGAVVYSNFEPCPMCLSAIYWSDVRAVFYCAPRSSAAALGFMDDHLYNELSLPLEKREIKEVQIPLQEMEILTDEWNGMEGKILY